jgi:ketosteroid isomerase-like protein
MDPITLCSRYFDAWNRHDAHAILATFAPGGTYRDPTTPGPIGGDALRGHIGALWAAFPDLAFAIGAAHRVGDERVHAKWTMTGAST